MILVTVGMQLGFDRLIAAMDRIAPGLGMPVIAQTGNGSYKARNMDVRPSITPGEFERLVKQAQLIVSHAGIGTVLTASRYDRPVLLMPRRAALGEHRNDHQLATVRGLGTRPGVLVAMDESELPDRIAQGLALEGWSTLRSPTAERMHAALARFIEASGT